MELLNIIRATENDDLTTVMQKIICTYTEQLTPMAKDIAQHIVTTFQQVLDGGDGGDEKAIAAMGLLNTLETLLTVLDDDDGDDAAPQQQQPKKVNPAHAALEPIVLQAINHVFSNSIAEFYEEVLTLACDLTTNTISPPMWGVLESVYTVFNGDGVDYFMDMMPLLHNYVTVDTDAFLSNPAYPNAMLAMCKTMFESSPGEDPECHAAKLLEVIILQCKGEKEKKCLYINWYLLADVSWLDSKFSVRYFFTHGLLYPGKNINELVTNSVHMVLQRLQGEIKTSELRTMCIQVRV